MTAERSAFLDSILSPPTGPAPVGATRADLVAWLDSMFLATSDRRF